MMKSAKRGKEMDASKSSCYYDGLALGYNELHGEEQKKKLSLVRQHLSVHTDETLLDIGCGTGISSDFVCTVFGLDPSRGLLRLNPSTRTVQGCGEFLPYKSESFDYVVSLTAIQNFFDIEKGIEEMRRVCKKNACVSVLKKSSKVQIVRDVIDMHFTITHEVEEEKDIIFVLSK